MPDYFTIAEFRARYPDLTVAKYSDTTVEQNRQLAEQAIEDACGVAFVPRTQTVTIAGDDHDGRLFDLGQPKVRTVTAATIGGTAINVTSARIYDTAVLLDTVAPSYYRAAATITYTHGYDAPPLRGKQAAMILTREWMVVGPVSERATQLATVDGGTLNLSTPGMFGSHFGIPEVDAFVKQYTYPRRVVGSIRTVHPKNLTLNAEQH